MAISDFQFHYNLLTEFLKAGGPINSLSQLDLTDIRRPFIQGRITEGFSRTKTSTVNIQLIGLDIANSSSAIYSQDCFDFNCIDTDNPNNITVYQIYKEEGLITTAPNVSNICFTKWTPNPLLPTSFNYDYVDKFFHPQLPNSECVLTEDGKETYFVRGTPDTLGNVYLADFGYISLIGNAFIPVEINVPFYIDEDNNFTAKSRQKLPSNIKAVKLKKVTNNQVINLGIVYGELLDDFYLPHTSLKTDRDLIKEEQEIVLENEVINLLLLSSFNISSQSENQIIYRNRYYSSPVIENTLQQSIQTFINLINTEAPFEGSVPAVITNYINEASQYNSLADDLYTQEQISCFEEECFSSECFSNFENKSLINRSIDNRALCWLVLLLASYHIGYSDTNIINSINSITIFLIEQLDRDTNLIYKGWDDLVLNDNYDNLTLNKDLICSTNCAFVMALLKTFEVTQDFIYLDLALKVKNAIDKYFLNNNNLYVHSFDINQATIESTTYQLLLSQILEDYLHTQNIIDFLSGRLNPQLIQEDGNVIVTNGDNVIVLSGDNVIITQTVEESLGSDNALFTPTVFDTIVSAEDKAKYNYLLLSSINRLRENFAITYYNELVEKYELIVNNTINNRINSTLIYVLNNLINSQSFLDTDLTGFYSAVDFYNLKFSKEIAFSNLIKNIPTDYDWFEPQVLTRTSTIGSLLYAIANGLAIVYTKESFLKRVSDIDYMYGSLLNEKANDYNIRRFNKENDENLRNRIKAFITKRSSTKSAIIQRLDTLDTLISIEDNYKVISAFRTSEDSPFNSEWSSGLLQGRKTATSNKASIISNQPIENDAYNSIADITPASVELDIIEVLSFNIGIDSVDVGVRITSIEAPCDHVIGEEASSPDEPGVDILYEDGNTICYEREDLTPGSSCDNIDLETADNIQTEQNDVICLEDETSIITELPPKDPIDPPPQEDEEDPEETCDCEGIRGYISNNGLPLELRNMRTVEDPLTVFYKDINATTGATNCDLLVTNKLSNNAITYLELETSYSIPTDISNIRKIEYIWEINSTQTIILWSSGISGNTQLSKFNPQATFLPSQTITLSVLNSVPFKAFNLINHIVIVYGTNNLLSIEKASLAINLSFSLPAEVSSLEFLTYLPNKVRIYSKTSTDDKLYFFEYDDSLDSILQLPEIQFTDTRNHTYFNDVTGIIRYSTNSTDTQIYSVPTFNSLGILQETISPLISNTSINKIQAFNNSKLLTTVNKTGTFASINMYSVRDDFIRFKTLANSLFTLQYLDTNNAIFRNTGETFIIGGFIFFTGSNNVYDVNTSILQNINLWRCSSDAIQIPTGYTIQSISISNTEEDTLLLSIVNLTTIDWLLYKVKVIKKVCN